MGLKPIRKNDHVMVIAGSDRGKKGKVLKVFPDSQNAVIEGVRFVKKHVRPNPKLNVKGGIVEREAPIRLSNLQIICPDCTAPVRTGVKALEGGRRVRACKACGGVIDR